MAIKTVEVIRGVGRRGAPGQPASIAGNGWARVTNGVVQSTATTPVKADVGLGNVDNTSDANKRISTQQAAGLANKLSLDDPQAVLLLQGRRAVVSLSIDLFSNLTGADTAITLDTAGAPITYTMTASLVGATTRPQVAANLAPIMTATSGYTWTVNGTSDGLIGTAKLPGIAYNSAPTGTALVGGVGSIPTLGLDAQTNTTATLQNLVIGAATFTLTGQTSRSWFDITDAPNGDRWATVYGVDIFKQSKGSALFVAQNAGALSWTGITATADGSIYAGVNSGDVWKNPLGTGVFIALGYANRSYAAACTHPNGVDIFFAASGGATGGVWKRTNGAGDFVEQGIATYLCTGVAVTSKGDVWTSVYNDNMYKKVGAAPFISQSQASLAWRGLTMATNGDLYAIVSNGDIYRRLASGGNFVAMGQASSNWYGIKGMRTGEVFAVVSGGDIYQLFFTLKTPIPF